jgi:hypothetical protein
MWHSAVGRARVALVGRVEDETIQMRGYACTNND